MSNLPEEASDPSEGGGAGSRGTLWMTLTLAGVVVLYILSAPVVEHHAMGGASFSKRPQWLHRYMQPWDWLTRVPLLSGPLQSYQSWYSVRKYEMPPVVEESPGVGAGR